MPRLLLVVPCYNEEKRLDVDAYRAFDGEILFVNYGSGDGTLSLLQSLQQSDPRRFSVLIGAADSVTAKRTRVFTRTGKDRQGLLFRNRKPRRRSASR